MTPDQIEKLITGWTAEIPEGWAKENARKILQERLTVGKKDTVAIGEAWRRCDSESRKIPQEKFDRRHVDVLRETVCDARSDAAAIGSGVARNWVSRDKEGREFRDKLAHALLGEDGKPCAPAKDYDENTKMLLRKAAGLPGLPSAVIAPK
jgi:hypothetical protein